MAEQAVAGYGHRVRLVRRTRNDDVEPPGVWRCLDSSPEPGCWWIMAVDSEARAWLADPSCPLPVQQRCIQWPSRAMRPPDVAALF